MLYCLNEDCVQGKGDDWVPGPGSKEDRNSIVHVGARRECRRLDLFFG